MLFGRPGTNKSTRVSPVMILNLTGANIFDTNQWRVSFGRFRKQGSPGITSAGTLKSSSYYLRCSRTSHDGRVLDYHSTSSLYAVLDGVDNDVLQNISSTTNASGAFISHRVAKH